MVLVTQNRIIIAILLSIIFSILLWKTSVLNIFSQKEGLMLSESPKIFFINMDKDTGRYRKLIKHYQNSDLSNERIHRYSAVVGKKVAPEKWLSSDALNELRLIEKNGYRTHHHSITRGGIGCFLSHYYLAKQLLTDSEHNMYLIFEDDTSILPNTYQQIKLSLESVPDNWDMLMFYTIRAVGHSENKTFHKLKSFWGMNCYLINKQGAKKFVEEVDKNKIDGQVDCYLSKMIQQNKMNIYSTKKHYVSSNSTDTNIQTILKPQKGVNPYDYKGYII
jgi:GR25 family glycosyltransferase involved in LPS biosynthesis